MINMSRGSPSPRSTLSSESDDVLRVPRSRWDARRSSQSLTPSPSSNSLVLSPPRASDSSAAADVPSQSEPKPPLRRLERLDAEMIDAALSEENPKATTTDDLNTWTLGDNDFDSRALTLAMEGLTLGPQKKISTFFDVSHKPSRSCRFIRWHGPPQRSVQQVITQHFTKAKKPCDGGARADVVMTAATPLRNMRQAKKVDDNFLQGGGQATVPESQPPNDHSDAIMESSK